MLKINLKSCCSCFQRSSSFATLPLLCPLTCWQTCNQRLFSSKFGGNLGWLSGRWLLRYSFFGTIPNFLNRLLDSLLLVRSTWNLQYLLVLDWTLAWFTFCKNRYFHDNDKQKSSKTVKLKFCTIQISLRKANTSILNCGVWQTKYTRTKKFCMFVLK